MTTRVKSPDEDDWVKLNRVLEFLKGNKYMNLTLYVYTISIIKWWVGASNRTYMDVKGHTDDKMHLGKVDVSIYSRKQILNTKSSTDS